MGKLWRLTLCWEGTMERCEKAAAQILKLLCYVGRAFQQRKRCSCMLLEQGESEGNPQHTILFPSYLVCYQRLDLNLL